MHNTLQARNNIKIVEGLSALDSLEHLNLSVAPSKIIHALDLFVQGNYIQHIPRDISANRALKTFDLSGNRLE